MSLKQFLVVGKSFADAPREKSPFEVRPEVRLPKFENAPRFTTKQPVPVQTDWLAARESRGVEPKGEAVPKKKLSKAKRNRSWLEILTFGFLGKKKPAAELVQEEMVLENVRVIRNDLADSDLEVVVNKSRKFTMRKVTEPQQKAVNPAEENGGATQPQERRPIEKKVRWRRTKRQEEWSELTVRLFEIGQH